MFPKQPDYHKSETSCLDLAYGANINSIGHLFVQQHMFQKSHLHTGHSTHMKRVSQFVLIYESHFPATLFEDTSMSDYSTLQLKIRPRAAAFTMYLLLWKQIPRYTVLTTIIKETNPSVTYRLYHAPGYMMWSYVVVRHLPSHRTNCVWCLNSKQSYFFDAERLMTDDNPTWQFWDSGGVKLESLCNFSIVVCQWTVNCLLG